MPFLFALLALFLPLNMVAVDPADLLILSLTILVIFFRPETLLFNKLQPIFLLLGSIFVASFVLSNLIGYDFRISASITINILLFILLYYALLVEKNPVMIGYMISAGFVALNILFFFLGIFDVRFPAFFEIFRDGRFLGTFGDPNFTGFTSVFVLIYFLDRVIENRSMAGRRLFDIVLMTLGAAFLFVSESRAAWGAGVIAMLAYFAVMGGKRFKFVIPGLFILIGLSVTLSLSDMLGTGQFGALADRLQSIFVQTDSAEAERFGFVYSRSSAMVGLDHPLGVGPGMVVQYTGLTNRDGMPIGSHNSFIQIFSELGWLALGSLLAIMGFTIRNLLPRAIGGWMLNDVSCRVIFAMMLGQVVFAMAHDMIAWRIGWLVPSLAICAAFAREMKVGAARGDEMPAVRPRTAILASNGGGR
jgi:hypothetical protein